MRMIIPLMVLGMLLVVGCAKHTIVAETIVQNVQGNSTGGISYSAGSGLLLSGTIFSINDSLVCTVSNGLCVDNITNNITNNVSVNGTDITPRNINFTGNFSDYDNSIQYSAVTERLCIGIGVSDCTDTNNTRLLLDGDVDSYGNTTTNSDNSSYAGYSISYSRGTSLSPITSQPGDFIGGLRWYAYNSTDYPEVGSIRGYVYGNVSNMTMTMNITLLNNITRVRTQVIGIVQKNITSYNINVSGDMTIQGMISGNGANINNLNMGNAATGTLAVARGGTGVTASTGTVNNVLSNGATMINLTISNGGFVKLGNWSTIVCNTTNEGFFAFNYTGHNLLYCNSTSWKTVI